MPKVLLTAEQRRKDAIAKRNLIVADGLNAYKGRKHLTCEELSKELGIGIGTLRSLLRGDGNPQLHLDQWWMVLSKSGMNVSVTRVDPPEIEDAR